MIRYIFLSMFLLLSAAVQAQSGLLISTTSNAPITIELDGRRFKEVNDRITVDDLPKGRHYLVVYRYRAYKDGNGGRAETIFRGSIKTKRYEITRIIIDENSGQARLSQLIPSANRDGAAVAIDPDRRRIPLQDQDDYNEKRPRSTLTDGYMERVRNNAEKSITDIDKLKSVESDLKGFTLTTDQLIVMFSWFNFESTKLELAKWAYPNVTDYGNYDRVANLLTFESSKTELRNFMKQSRNR